MRHMYLTLAVLGSLFCFLQPKIVAATEQPPQTGVGVDDLIGPALRESISTSMAKGVTWLQSQQKGDGSFAGEHHTAYPLGETALGSLVLAACGMSPRRSSLSRAIDHLRQTHSSIKKEGGLRFRTYGVALTILALVESQGTSSTMGSQKIEIELPEGDRVWLDSMKRWLVRNQSRKKGTWRYPRPDSQYDLSNTQFALLALKAAQRAGVEVKARIYFDALKTLLTLQEETGPSVPRYARESGPPRHLASVKITSAHDRARGFGYQGSIRPSGSMTAAGVVGLAVCQTQLLGRHPHFNQELRFQTQQAVHDGIAWLGNYFSVEELPDPHDTLTAAEKRSHHYYYLYSLERACGVSSTELAGKWDWYRSGAAYLLHRQRADGSWPVVSLESQTEQSSFLSTCYALLFLSRLSDPESRRVTPQVKLDLSLGPKLDDNGFQSIFATALRRYQRGGELALPAREFVKMGPRVYECLVGAMSSEDPDEREASFAVISSIRGKTLGYRPHDTEKKRESALKKWRVDAKRAAR